MPVIHISLYLHRAKLIHLLKFWLMPICHCRHHFDIVTQWRQSQIESQGVWEKAKTVSIFANNIVFIRLWRIFISFYPIIDFPRICEQIYLYDLLRFFPAPFIWSFILRSCVRFLGKKCVFAAKSIPFSPVFQFSATFFFHSHSAHDINPSQSDKWFWWEIRRR